MSSTNQAPPKKSKGRQKVTMVKMKNESNLQVTFSKRRAGLFKKASELCTLCGAEAAIVVFSPANKAYCFGHPDFQAIIDRFESQMEPVPTNDTSRMIMEAHRNSSIRELNLEFTRVESMLRAEKKLSEELHQIRKAGNMQHWYPPPFDKFKYEQLDVLKGVISRLKKDLDLRVEKAMLNLATTANPVLPSCPNPLGQSTNPWGFSFGVGENISQVHTSNTPFAVGTSNFSPYVDQRAMGLINNGLMNRGSNETMGYAAAGDQNIGFRDGSFEHGYGPSMF